MITFKAEPSPDVLYYRDSCACGARFGEYPTAADKRIGDQFRTHFRKMRKLPAGADQCQSIVTPVTAAEKAAEELAYKRRYAERLRDNQIPERRAEVFSAIATVAEDLRRHADALDKLVAREAAGDKTGDGFGEGPSYAVEEAQHEVLWGVANLGLDRLLGRVREYDAAKRELTALLAETKEG